MSFYTTRRSGPSGYDSAAWIRILISNIIISVDGFIFCKSSILDLNSLILPLSPGDSDISRCGTERFLRQEQRGVSDFWAWMFKINICRVHADTDMQWCSVGTCSEIHLYVGDCTQLPGARDNSWLPLRKIPIIEKSSEWEMRSLTAARNASQSASCSFTTPTRAPTRSR